MFIKIVVIALLLQLSQCEDDKKWVWKKNEKNARYSVIEEGPFRPTSLDFDRPSRPLGIHQGVGFPDRPFQNRPGNGFVGNERPGDHYPNRPGSAPGILTGPVPSWVEEPPFKHYDKCKCAEKFNCNSPGISYGQCDVGKQYCCYSSNGVIGGALPNRPNYSPENGVLVGPGGPSHYPSGPHLSNNGILVGPGGPTGIIGRPPIRPYDRPDYGNYGHFSSGPYGKRNVLKNTKDDIK